MIEISSSKIKEITKYGWCPKFFKAKYIDKSHDTIISHNIFRGVYFEYALLGNLPKNGETPIYPKLKKGGYEIAKKRIDRHITEFPEVLKKEGIEIIAGTQEVAWKYSPGITITLTLDALGIYKGKLYVIDIKLTPDLDSKFGAVPWGNYDEMDKIQAYLYAYVMSQVLGEEVGFIYMVFEYRAKKHRYKIFEEVLTKEKKDYMFDKLIKTERGYRWAEQTKFRPRGSEKVCKTCPIENCHARIEEDKKDKEPFVKVPEQETVKINLDDLIESM